MKAPISVGAFLIAKPFPTPDSDLLNIGLLKRWAQEPCDSYSGPLVYVLCLACPADCSSATSFTQEKTTIAGARSSRRGLGSALRARYALWSHPATNCVGQRFPLQNVPRHCALQGNASMCQICRTWLPWCIRHPHHTRGSRFSARPQVAC